MANTSAAIRPSFWATASCLPIGAPHCTRSAAQRRANWSARFEPATAEAGRVRRPVFRVMSASLRPLPSPHRTFSTGTFTLVKRMIPFSMALSPMKWSRWTTSTPGQSVSTMNARDPLRSRPGHHDQQLGDGAVGAPELLAVQDVVRAVLGERRRRGEARGVGPDTVFGQRERRDRSPREARQVALLLLRRSEQLERRRDPDRLGGGEQGGEIAVLAGHHADRVGVAVLAQTQAAVLGGDLDPERTDLAEAADHVLRDLALAIDPVAVHPLAHEALEPGHERPRPLEVLGIRRGEGMDEVEAERTLEQLADEARRLPFLLARRLRDLAGLLLGGERGARISNRWLGKYVSHGWPQG